MIYKYLHTNSVHSILKGLKPQFISVLMVIPVLFLLSGCTKEPKISDNQKTSFIKFYGGAGIDEGVDVIQGENNEYFVIGNYSSSDNGTDVVFLHLDAYGNLVNKPLTFGNENNQEAVCLRMNDKGEIFILANTESLVSGGFQSDIYLIKTNRNGDSIWTKTYGTESSNEVAKDMLIDNEEKLVITGYSDLQNDLPDVLYMRILNSGDLETLKVIDASSNSTSTGISVKAMDSYYFLCGNTNKDIPNSIFFKKADKLGKISAADGYSISEAGLSVSDVIIKNDTYFVLGTKKLVTDKNEIVLMQFSVSTFEFIQSFTFSNAENLIPASMVLEENDILISGTLLDENNDPLDYFIKKIGTDGTEKYFETGGDISTNEHIRKMISTADGGYLLLGSSTYDKNSRIALYKTNFDGIIDLRY